MAVADPPGFEPGTTGLEAPRSVQAELRALPRAVRAGWCYNKVAG